MSDNHPEKAHAQAHTGATKNSQTKVFLALVVAVVVIVALLYYYVAGLGAPAITTAGASASSQNEQARAEDLRIEKVGSVTIELQTDANRPPRTGEEVFKAQCITCHGTGLMGSPKFGDAVAWAPRIQQGFDALLNSALHGKNSMPAQGGGAYSDYEVARAVVYMANDGGAKFPEPPAPAVPADGAAATEPAAPQAAAAAVK